MLPLARVRPPLVCVCSKNRKESLSLFLVPESRPGAPQIPRGGQFALSLSLVEETVGSVPMQCPQLCLFPLA